MTVCLGVRYTAGKESFGPPGVQWQRQTSGVQSYKKLEGVVWEDISRTFNPIVESFLEKRSSRRDLKEKQVKESKGFVLCTWARRQDFESLRNL